MLPNVVPIYEDEQIHSWIERLAIANGCSRIEELLACYHLRAKKKRVVSARSYLAPILEAAEIENWAEFYVSHTEYALVAPFVDDYHQMVLLDCAFANRPLAAEIVRFLACPECQKEKPYLRVWHNLPGVKVCYRHKTTLVPVKSGLELVEPSNSSVSIEDVKYAKYCHDLHLAKLPYNVSYFNRIIGKEKSNKMISTRDKMIGELMEKYPDVSDLPKQITRSTPLPSGYTLVYQCGGVLELEHECGKRYCMTAKGLETGFFCPSCSAKLTENEIVECFVNTAGNGEYKLIVPFKNGDKNVKLLHNVCKAEFEIGLNSFLSGTRCKCERHLTIEMLRIKFPSEYPDFIPVSRQGNKITIRHKDCGKEFDLRWKDWVRYPTCRYCDPPGQHSFNSISKELEEIGLNLISVNEVPTRKPKVTVICNQGHRSVGEFYHIRSIGGCPQCMYSRDHFSSNLILDYLKANYQDKLFFYDDLSDMFGSVRTKRALQYMRNTKQVSVLASGCYTLSGNNTENSEREIIIQKYIRRDDETIGYLYGYSFSYYILGIGEEPEIVSIATKKYASPKGHLLHYSNSTLRLRRVPEGMNEENWKAVQVADFIDGIYLFWGSATKYIEVLFQYIEDNNISKTEIVKHITNRREVVQRIKKRLLE